MERSLEDFIARANAVPPLSPAPPKTTVLQPPQLASSDERGPHRASPEVASRRARARSRPLEDDKTEIVARPLPYTPPGRGLTWILIALAFAAGGAAVILAVRLVAPRPAPTPAISIVPPVIVIPQPTVEKLPEPAVEPVPVPVQLHADEPKAPVPAKPAEPPKKRAKKAEKDPKAPSGLVDPFAE